MSKKHTNVHIYYIYRVLVRQTLSTNLAYKVTILNYSPDSLKLRSDRKQFRRHERQLII